MSPTVPFNTCPSAGAGTATAGGGRPWEIKGARTAKQGGQEPPCGKGRGAGLCKGSCVPTEGEGKRNGVTHGNHKDAPLPQLEIRREHQEGLQGEGRKCWQGQAGPGRATQSPGPGHSGGLTAGLLSQAGPDSHREKAQHGMPEVLFWKRL